MVVLWTTNQKIIGQKEKKIFCWNEWTGCTLFLVTKDYFLTLISFDIYICTCCNLTRDMANGVVQFVYSDKQNYPQDVQKFTGCISKFHTSLMIHIVLWYIFGWRNSETVSPLTIISHFCSFIAWESRHEATWSNIHSCITSRLMF